MGGEGRGKGENYCVGKREKVKEISGKKEGAGE